MADKCYHEKLEPQYEWTLTGRELSGYICKQCGVKLQLARLCNECIDDVKSGCIQFSQPIIVEEVGIDECRG